MNISSSGVQWPQFCSSSPSEETAPQSAEQLGLALQEKGAVLFVGNSLADTVGTLLEAFRAQGISATASTFTPGVVLIMVGGGLGVGALSLFVAGHVKRESSEESTTSSQPESDHYLTRDRLNKFSTYGAAYSCATGGLLDTAGTLIEIFRKAGAAPFLAPLGKGLLITSTILNAAGLMFALGEAGIWLSGKPSKDREDAEVNVPQNEGGGTTDLTLEQTHTSEPADVNAPHNESGTTTDPMLEQTNTSASAEQSGANAEQTKWDLIKLAKVVGEILFATGNLLDSVGTLTTDFSGTPSDNSSQTDNTTGSTILTTACVMNLLGLGMFAGAYIAEKFYSSSPSSEDTNSSSDIELDVEAPDNTENATENDGLFHWLKSDLYYYATQAGYPY